VEFHLPILESLVREGLWQKLLSHCMPELVGETRFIDSTFVKVHQDGANPAGGQQGQDMGRTKGGLNTKVHAAVDKKGNPEVLILGPGQEADISMAQEVVSSMDLEKLVADKGYDSNAFRAWLHERGIAVCIPPRSNRLNPLPYSKRTYRNVMWSKTSLSGLSASGGSQPDLTSSQSHSSDSSASRSLSVTRDEFTNTP